MNKGQENTHSRDTNIEDDMATSSRKHLVISEFNLVINYAPYLGIFVFPLKDNIFRKFNKIGTVLYFCALGTTKMVYSDSLSHFRRTSQEKCQI